MKRLVSLFYYSLLIHVCIGQSLEQNSWKDDALYLKSTIHSKYPNLFYNVTPAQFDSAVDVLIAGIPAMEEYEFQAGIGKIMAMSGNVQCNGRIERYKRI